MKTSRRKFFRDASILTAAGLWVPKSYAASLGPLDTGFWGSFAISPPALSGLAGWYRSDSLNLADGTAVGNGSTTDWIDQSGNGHTMSQPTVGSRPVYNINKFGNKPGIRFSGTVISLFTGTPFSFGDFTLFFVWKYSTVGDGLLMGNSTINRQIRNTRSGVEQASFYNGSVEIISNTITGSGTGTTDPKCMVYRRTGSTGDFFYNNAKFSAASGSTNGTIALDQFCFAVGSGVNNINGWLAEVLLYSSFKTDADVNTMYTGYLKPRWGLP